MGSANRVVIVLGDAPAKDPECTTGLTSEIVQRRMHGESLQLAFRSDVNYTDVGCSAADDYKRPELVTSSKDQPSVDLRVVTKNTTLASQGEKDLGGTAYTQWDNAGEAILQALYDAIQEKALSNLSMYFSSSEDANLSDDLSSEGGPQKRDALLAVLVGIPLVLIIVVALLGKLVDETDLIPEPYASYVKGITGSGVMQFIANNSTERFI